MSNKVLLYPPISGGTNYSISLRRELSGKFLLREGFGPRIPLAFSLGCLIFQTRHIHFDWIHMYYQNNNRILHIIKIIFFTIDVFILRFILRAKTIVVLHNVKPHTPGKIPFSDWFCHHLILSNASGVRYFSKYAKTISEKYLKYTALVSDVSPEESPYTTNNYSVLNRFETKSSNSTKILVIGNVLKYKNIHELLTDIAQYLVESKATLIVAGRPVDTAYAKSLVNLVEKLNIKRFVRFQYEWLDESQFCKLIAQSSVVINYQKRFTNTGILEYCRRFEKPLVTRNCSGISEHYTTKRLFFSNVQEFLKVIQNLPSPPYYIKARPYSYTSFVSKVFS